VLAALVPADAQAYLHARLAEAGIHADPFEAAAVQLLLQAANGLPRLLNHLAQRALEAAAAQNSRQVTIATSTAPGIDALVAKL